MSKGKILLMDDNNEIRATYSKVLSRLGYIVHTARDGLEAIALYNNALTDNPFDAVILNLTVPDGMGGEVTMRKLLEIDPNVKAIIFSGNHNDPVMTNFNEYGFRAALAKPYKIRELDNVIQKAIGV